MIGAFLSGFYFGASIPGSFLPIFGIVFLSALFLSSNIEFFLYLILVLLSAVFFAIYGPSADLEIFLGPFYPFFYRIMISAYILLLAVLMMRMIGLIAKLSRGKFAKLVIVLTLLCILFDPNLYISFMPYIRSVCTNLGLAKFFFTLGISVPILLITTMCVVLGYFARNIALRHWLTGKASI